MISTVPLYYLDSAKDIPTWIVAVVFFIPFAGGLFLYFYKTRHARSWRKGIHPPHLKFNQDNLLEAYLALGSLLILLDYQKSKGKSQFINNYFNRYFKSANYNFGDSLLFSINHPIKIDTVCEWLNNNLDEEGERAQVIYFLTGLALLKDSLSERELKFLQVMNSKLNLPDENLRRIIAIYEAYHSSKQNTRNEANKKPSKTTKLSQYLNILGLDKITTKEELKKAYRSLAKQHHPDVFANASDAQQRIAEEKFVQIQEAYDYLNKTLGQ